MTNRQLFEGMEKSEDVTYDALVGELQDGEVLVATWLRNPFDVPDARLIASENDYEHVVDKVRGRYHIKLRWFASTTGSTDPADYGK